MKISRHQVQIRYGLSPLNRIHVDARNILCRSREVFVATFERPHPTRTKIELRFENILKITNYLLFVKPVHYF
jgi:hypothetical protein